MTTPFNPAKKGLLNVSIEYHLLLHIDHRSFIACHIYIYSIQLIRIGRRPTICLFTCVSIRCAPTCLKSFTSYFRFIFRNQKYILYRYISLDTRFHSHTHRIIFKRCMINTEFELNWTELIESRDIILTVVITI